MNLETMVRRLATQACAALRMMAAAASAVELHVMILASRGWYPHSATA
jgi:hypothetical protein